MPQNKAFEISEDICQDLKLDITDINEGKFFIKGKTKLSWTKNKFAQTFFIVVKTSGQNSIINVYYGGIGVMGPDTGTLIQPFYKKLIEKTGMTLELETGQIRIKEKDIEKSANDYVNVSNNYEYSAKGSLTKGFENTAQQQTPDICT
jgi:hypothetical protein